MLKTIRGVVRDGKVILLESADVPEDAPVLVTVLANDETQFWLDASKASLDLIWGNSEDDIYGRLLKK